MDGQKNAFALLMRGAKSQEAAGLASGLSQRPPPTKAPAAAPARPLARTQGGQLHLDLGQRDFAVATCPTCGMMYGKGLAEEERLHVQFHNAHDAAFRFPGWAAERVVLRSEGPCRGRLLCVLQTDPPAQWRKVSEVCGRLGKVLGVPEGHLLAPQPPFKVFLWMSHEAVSAGGSAAGSGCGGGGGSKGSSKGGRVVGVLVAQLQSRAHRRRLEVAEGPRQQLAAARQVRKPQQQQQQQRQQHPHQHSQQHQQPSSSEGPGCGSVGRPWQAAQPQAQSQQATKVMQVQEQGQAQLPQTQSQVEGKDAAAAAPSAQLELEADGRAGPRAAAEAGGGNQAPQGSHDARAAKRPRATATPAELQEPSASASTGTGGHTAGSQAVCKGGRVAATAPGPSASAGAAATSANTAAAAAATGGVAASTPAARAVLGVRGVWVEPGCRRRGIARRMLDAARACMVPGFLAARSEVAFSACAAAAAAGEPDGGAAFAAFAASYGGGGAGVGSCESSVGGPARGEWALLYDDEGDGA